MYIPGTNNWKDREEILHFMREHPFAILVSYTESGIVATHIPVEVVEENDALILYSHMARANTQWKFFTSQVPSMFIFSGPHTYISSSWYDHVNVPTWNYLAVHAYGAPEILSGDDSLKLLHRLVARFEKPAEPHFSIEQMSDAEVEAHMKALVAFRMKIDKLDAKAKLSQNRDKHNYDRIIDALGERDDADSLAIKQEMLKRRDQIK